MIITAAVLVVGDDQKSLVPVAALLQRIVKLLEKRLPISHIDRWVGWTNRITFNGGKVPSSRMIGVRWIRVGSKSFIFRNVTVTVARLNNGVHGKRSLCQVFHERRRDGAQGLLDWTKQRSYRLRCFSSPV